MSDVHIIHSRYKESLTKSTKGFRERLRTRGGIMQDIGARAREVSAGVVRALERMSVEPGTDRLDAPNSPGQPSGTQHHPPDHPPDRLGSGSGSAESPRSNLPSTIPTPSVTATPELSNGAER